MRKKEVKMKNAVLLILLLCFPSLEAFSIKRLDLQVVDQLRVKIEKEIFINRIVKNSLLIAPVAILSGILIYNNFLSSSPEMTLNERVELQQKQIDRLNSQHQELSSHVGFTTSGDVQISNSLTSSVKPGFVTSVFNYILRKADSTKDFIKNSVPIVGTLIFRQALFGGLISKISTDVGEIFVERDIYWAVRKGSIYKILDNLKSEAAFIDPNIVDGIKADITQALQKFASRIDEFETDQISLESFSQNLGNSVKLVTSDSKSILTQENMNEHLVSVEISCNTLIASLERLIAYMEFRTSKISDPDKKQKAEKSMAIMKTSTNNFSESIERSLNSVEHKLLTDVVGFQAFICNLLSSFSELE